MDGFARRIAESKAELDALRPLRSDALLNLRSFYDVELTYTSNAIEGNSLTLRETARSSRMASRSAGSRCATISRRSTSTTPCNGCALSPTEARR